MKIAVWKKLTSSDAAKIELSAKWRKQNDSLSLQIIHTFYK